MDYLDFDTSEDEHGCASLEAMASVSAAQVAAVQAEIQQVLGWAQAAFPGLQAPLDEGGEWDFQVQQQVEIVAGQTRQTFTLSLTGTPQFCEAFRQQFPVN
ncbi:hypothetical protein [Rhodoferax sp.]|uniref:hypothetical protein n=1 Tax=Rhodoferax sp. TaxID=50421 RepID=UPI0025D410E9|nr:hypothetical protein [Rhodoferax sp.]